MMKIIPARVEHIPEIVEIWKEFIDYHGEFEPVFSRREDGHLNFGKFVGKLLEQGGSQVLTMVEGKRVIAYSIARIESYPPVFLIDKYGAIWDLVVKDEFRRRGIGGKMLTRIVEWFKSKGVDRIELKVVAKNAIGCSFWEKQGFREYMKVMCWERNKEDSLCR